MGNVELAMAPRQPVTRLIPAVAEVKMVQVPEALGQTTGDVTLRGIIGGCMLVLAKQE
jgi:hypothetical protein